MATDRGRPRSKDAAGTPGSAAQGRWAAAPAYAVAPADVVAIAHAEHGDPFSVLGPHPTEGGRWEVRAFLPQAASAKVVGRDGAGSAEMRKLDPSGFFVAALSHEGAEAPAYRLSVETAAGTQEIEDPYRFAPILTEFDLHLLHEGSDRELYSKLGAHPATLDGVDGFRFAVWAPNARRVSVVGDFNNWDGRRHAMRKRHQAGVWEIFLPGLVAGASYKFEIRDRSGHLVPLKADPFAFSCEHPPATASRLHGLPQVTWNDHGWLAKRGGIEARKSPISIYEVHIGSWMRAPDEGDRRLTYRELAERLVAYVKDMGFTHIELLPITEFPFDGSWGYQPISLFAPTSRHGGPEDFAVFVEACHEAGIGILLDWVPGHFPVDAHGLGQFDGTHLYEHADPRQGFHQDWGTLIYNYGRNEVTNFLIASARFWLDRYHLDGLRVDAVASMLYLDYSRKAGEWVPNRHGGNENLDAISFFRRMNELTYADTPGTITVAEESTAWPGVSQPTYLGGLGFGFKWNMGWMNDTLRYMQQEPIHRRWHHNLMTFGLVYAFSENFVLPLSHDEVVHGKGSLLTRMPGDRWQKFANLRAYFGFMYGHPGKKLLFMGGEFAQEREWNHDASLDWHLLDDPLHKGMQSLIRDLNHLYRDVPALHQRDCEPSGFAWIDAGDAENSVLAWLRRGEAEDRIAVCVSNFTPVPREGYRVGVPYPGWYAERLNSDSAFYGGSDVGLGGGRMAEEVPLHGQPYSISLTLPPLATVILVREA